MGMIKLLTCFPALFGWVFVSILGLTYVEAPLLVWPVVGGAVGFVTGVLNIWAGGRLPWGLVLVMVLVPTLASAQPNHLDDLRSARAEYGTPMSKVELGRLLNGIAWEFRNEGWGLLRKPQGNNCPSPGGVDVACDILVYSPTGIHFDVLRDAEGAAQPVWNNLGGIDMSRFVAPVDVSGGTPPSPAPTPEPEPALPPELWELLTRIEEGQLLTLQVVQEVKVDLKEHREAVRQGVTGWERWLVQRVLPILGAVLGIVAGVK